MVAERCRGENTAGDGQRGRCESREEHGESWFQWSFAPAGARASLKRNQLGRQSWTNARDGTQTRKGRRRCGVARRTVDRRKGRRGRGGGGKRTRNGTTARERREIGSEWRAGSSGALLQTVLELCSSGTTVGSHVGRMRTMIRRDEGDADDTEWRDERSNRREGGRREHECDDSEGEKGNKR